MYKEYSQKYYCWCEFYDNINEEIRIIHKYINFENSCVLEVGCGTGRFTEKILFDNPQNIIAIDNDEESINIAKNHISDKRIDFRLLDANDIANSFSNETFDYVVFSWSLNYIINYSNVIYSSLKKCKPKGKIVILFPFDCEYSKLIASMRKSKESNVFSENNYYSIKTFLLNNGLELFEDDIVTDFEYPNISVALKANLFHWELLNNPLTNSELKTLERKLMKYKQVDCNNVCIQDKVKLLIGGKLNNEKCNRENY